MGRKLNYTKIGKDLPLEQGGTRHGHNTHNKIILGVIISILALVTIASQVFGNQTGLAQAEANLRVDNLSKAPRGLFYDRNGAVLVENVAAYDLKIATASEGEIEKLANILKIDADELSEKFRATKDVLLSNVSEQEMLQISDQLTSTDFTFTPAGVRKYRYPRQFAQLLGYTGPASVAELQQGYDGSDQVGKYRLEKVWEDELKGVKGRQVKLGDVLTEVPAQSGNDVTLTIDAKWQRSLYTMLGRQVDALGAQAGAAVIMEIDTGKIRSYVSYPSFNPNALTVGISEKEYQKLLQDRRKPLVDKVASLQAAPGSSFKLVTAVAALESEVIDATTRIFSTGCRLLGSYQFCEFGKRSLGWLDITDALAKSSNIYFCNAGLSLVQDKGWGRFVKIANSLGLGVQTGIGWPDELKGTVPSEAYKRANYKESWFAGDTCNSAIGQGMVAVTPLQMAGMMATIANGGDYYQPILVERVTSPTGQVVADNFVTKLRSMELKDSTVDLIMSGTSKVAQSQIGTAYRFLHSVPGNFTAKTGSAETFELENGKKVDRVHSWIVGTFEYKGRKYAYSAHIHFGGGGWNVTPVMRDFANCLFSNFAGQCL